MGGISDLDWAVGTKVGIGRRWQRRGRRCSRSCRLGIARRTLGCRIDAQMVVVIAAFDGFRGLDLAPALPLAPFLPPGCSPSTAPMPYLPSYGCNALGPSLDISVVVVVVALFVFVPDLVPVAECSFPCRACRRHPNSDSPLDP